MLLSSHSRFSLLLYYVIFSSLMYIRCIMQFLRVSLQHQNVVLQITWQLPQRHYIANFHVAIWIFDVPIAKDIWCAHCEVPIHGVSPHPCNWLPMITLSLDVRNHESNKKPLLAKALKITLSLDVRNRGSSMNALLTRALNLLNNSSSCSTYFSES